MTVEEKTQGLELLDIVQPINTSDEDVFNGNYNANDYPKTREGMKLALNHYAQKYRGFTTYEQFRTHMSFKIRQCGWEIWRKSAKRQSRRLKCYT